MNELINSIAGYLWSPFFVCLCICSGIFFSFSTRFVQIRHFREMLVLLFKSKTDSKGTSSFQSFCIALSGKIGTGNIVGVATAIGFGGPGAIVWMWIIALFGAATSFVECTLSQIYKVGHKDDYYGGPAYYIEKGINSKFLAIMFALVSVISHVFLLIPVQITGIVVSLQSFFDIPNILIGVVTAFFIGLVIIGGIRRIASVAEILCPLMALGYVLLAVIVLIVNIESIPSVFMEMLRSAVGLNPALSGILGSTITLGVKRGIFSNEAGQGTGAIVSGSAGVSHPVKQGLSQSFSVYIDTLMICTATALIILSAGTYNVFTSDMSSVLVSNVNAPDGSPGVLYTSSAIAQMSNAGFASVSISASLFLFVFTTILAFSYYSESNLFYLFKFFPFILRYEKVFLTILRILILFSILHGSVSDSLHSWDLADVGLGLMSWINFIVILILSPKVFRTLKDYEQQKKKGIDPVFDPDKLNIKNADCWKKKL